MERIEFSTLYKNVEEYKEKKVIVCGWIRTIRDSKSLGFIELNDGSTFKNMQIVLEEDKLTNFKEIVKLNVGASVIVEGNIVLTPDAKQCVEIHATSIKIEGKSDETYPLQKKRHSVEFLRTIAHLRPRTNLYGAAFRVRSKAAFAIHEFYNKRGFVYVNTPIFTGSDCEGAGEMFQVTTLDLDKIPRDENKQIDYSKDFFGKKMSLTVTGQLEAEALVMAFGKVYTFGPTFRAENSNTTRHASEFWMMEPEIAFCELSDVMDLEEDMVKYVLKYVLEECFDEMNFFNDFIDKTLIERLNNVVNAKFERITYTKAIEILEKNKENFEFPVYWGVDIATEHERYLAEVVYKKPVFVTDYPKEIKAFYMKQNEDGKTVQAVDLLVPGIGEMIGGSQREENYDKLKNRIIELGLNVKDYEWYLDTRKYGSVNHGGFGLGFERLLMYITGINNIRDVLIFPRTPGNAEF